MEISFAGKNAVVTGASRGLGRAIAMMLAENGANIMIGDVLDAQGEETCAEIRRTTGREAAYMHTDVRKAEQVDALLRSVPAVDAVVHAAGITVPEDLLSADDDKIRRLFDINILGSSNLVRSALRVMIPRKSGKIVLISSAAGRFIDKTVTHYRMSKAAVLSLTMSAARYAAQYDININAVCPGIVRTQMWEELLDEKASSAGRPREEVWHGMLDALIPLRRPQTESDIAAAAAFLLSDLAKNITGQALNVDGGQCMQI